MDKQEALDQIAKFRHRLISDVFSSFQSRGSDYGNERFEAWKHVTSKFLDGNFPGARSRLEEKLRHFAMTRGRSESDYDWFLRYYGTPSIAFLDSLAVDIKNDEYNFERAPAASSKSSKETPTKANSVFIVHGHDEALKVKAARFVERLGINAIILHEQASRGQTIIEKIETNTNVGFAIVLYTEDDLGHERSKAISGELNGRARQNVVFEHGYLIAKLGRACVTPLVSGKLELPSDISGVVYVDDSNWQIDIAKEMRAAGYVIDFNKLVDS